MKKLLILLSLTTAMTAFGADTTTMNISATVLEPLNVSHNGDINFGNLIQNTTTTIDQAKTFTVHGSVGGSIHFTINDRPIREVTQTTISKGNDTLPVYFDNIQLSSDSLTLDNSGNFTFSFKPRIYVPQNQAAGTYTGALTARVQYE